MERKPGINSVKGRVAFLIERKMNEMTGPNYSHTIDQIPATYGDTELFSEAIHIFLDQSVSYFSI
jgi:hypothetical protein